MTEEQFLASLNTDQNAALLVFRDKLVTQGLQSLNDYKALHQKDVDADKAKISTLESDLETANTDHAAALRAEKDNGAEALETQRVSYEERIAALQGLPAPDSVKTISLQLALLAFGSSPEAVTQIINTVIPETDENGTPLREAALLRWSNLEGGVRRDHALVSAVQAGLQWSNEKIDALFALARKFDVDADYVPVVDDLALAA